MTNHRGDVVVRVRTIVENIAGTAAAAAAVTAGAAAEAADHAHHRARRHPLGSHSGPLAAIHLMTAVGTASALRETALTASRRSALAHQTLDDMRREAMVATAERKAAQRLVDRRIAAVKLERERAQQRTLDENAASPRKSR
jgi:hypothetical protein